MFHATFDGKDSEGQPVETAAAGNRHSPSQDTANHAEQRLS